MSAGIRVTATDLASPEESDTLEIMDNYVLITAGTCRQTYVQVHHAKDGTQTHVITVKGVRRSVPTGQEASDG
jgi:hypothetical protein